MNHRTFRKSPRLRRALAIVFVVLLAFAPSAGVAAADTAVIVPPRPSGLDFGSQLDPRFIAELKTIETRVLQEQEQGRQFEQQKQAAEAQIQANNQKAAAVQQKVSGWNSKTATANQQAAALGERIDAHNAKPNTFELPRQAAQAQAYQAEVNELRSEQNQLQSQQNGLDQEKSAISAEQNQVQSEGQQLDNQKQQLNQQITAHNNEVRQLQGQIQQLLQQVVSALQAAAAAQQENGTEGDQAAGGDHGRPVDTTQNNGQAGNDGGDPSSPKATYDALDKYGKDNDVTVYKQPVRVLLTPDTVSQLSPDTAAGLSPYRTYDGLVPNSTSSFPNLTYTALEVVAPGATPDPFTQAINHGGQATVEVDGTTRVITRVQTVPGGRPSPQSPAVPAPDPAILAIQNSVQDDDPLKYGLERVRPLPGEDSPDSNNKPEDRPERCTKNWQVYGDLQTVTFQGQQGERATGAEACVVSVYRGTRPQLRFDLFGLNTAGARMARCHLIAHSLYGSSSKKDLGNFVPCYQDPTNNSWMYSGFEAKIAAMVVADNGANSVYMEVRPIYRGANPVPVGIQGWAYSSNGLKCTVWIPNVTSAQAREFGINYNPCKWS